MNKNPFLPTPSYTPQQPPLPPGPPPPQPGQPDYSTWWAGAAAQQPHVQQPAPYNTQWQASQPARPPAEQSALYANYGYGNQSNWQRQQHHQYHPPAVVQQHAPPPMQAYNPYPAAGAYSQPYVPQAAPPQPVVQPSYPHHHHHHPSQPQIFAPPLPSHQLSTQHQPTQARQHASPQHPPAKRQRFDGPGTNRHHHPQQHHSQPPPPQFQPPPPPPPTSGSLSNRPPSGPSGRGGGPGGPRGSRGGRGGSMSSGRGGLGGGRGRGGNFSVGGNGRTGPGNGQQSGQTNRHNSRNFGGDKIFHNRRGGSFTGGNSGSGYSHSASSSFRGRNQGHSSSGRGSRGDGSGLGSRDGTLSSSFGGKRDENRRTLTDFKIVGLEIPELGWTWGIVPSPPQTNKGETISDEPKEEFSEANKAADSSNIEGIQAGSKKEESQDVPPGEVETSEAQASQVSDPNPHSPPSRIRIYFHTPVTADDSRPIPHNSSYSEGSMDSRKGKRKKLEDDDGELDDTRVPPPPPQMAGVNEDRVSVAGSVGHSVESASEADWLMAAIVEGEDESKAIAEVHAGEESEDGEQLQISEIVNADEHVELEGDGNNARIMEEAVPDGTSHMDDKNVDGNLNNSLGVSATATSADLGEARTGSAETTSLFTGSPSRASQVEGDQIAEVSAVTDAPELHEENAVPSAPVLSAHASESLADITDTPEKQIQQGSSLTSEPTLLEVDIQDGSQAYESASLSNGHQATQMFDSQLEHLPEPPASPAISSMAYEDSSSLVSKGDTKAGKAPSANRLSVSYARSNRRLVINAEVVETLKLFRHEGRIEVIIKVQKQEDGTLRGILTEGLSEVTKSYLPFSAPSEESAELDATVPPLFRATSSNLQLLVHLDTARPLSEPKWAKTGDIQDWLKSMFGRMFWVAGEAADGWEKKLQVVDPDPPPTIWTVLEGWASNSPVGALSERQRFLKTHMTEVDNILEILLRLVRGERATPFSQAPPALSSPNVTGPLLTALNGSAHGAQQTHVSLAVLAIFRMTTEYAEIAAGDKGKTAVEERVGEIVRCLPSHLLYKSLDGIFKEWRVEKKGRNTYDSDNTVFSPQGRLHQVEYALEAVKQGSAAVGLRSKTHAVLLALKRSTGELASYQQKMFRIDDHVGIAIAGLTSDARVLSNFMRQQALASKMAFSRPVPVNRLVSAIADKAQVNTQEYGRRPYGVGFLVIGQDKNGPHLYEFQPTGNSYEYYAMSIGARSQSAKTYLEKNYEDFADASIEALIMHGLHALRETLQQDKALNINNTSIGILGPQSEFEEKQVIGGSFRILESGAVSPFLKTMIPKPGTSTTSGTVVFGEDGTVDLQMG